MASSQNTSPLSPWLLWLAAPLLCVVVGFALLPRPVDVATQTKVERKRGTAVVFDKAPKVRSKLGVNLQNKVRIVGVDLPSKAVGQGERLRVKTVFEALSSMNSDWQIFLHIDLAEGNNFRIHGDHHPAGGRMKTSLWKKGDFVVDDFTKRVPLDAPSGKYNVWLGFYSGSQRLRFVSGDAKRHDGDNRIKLGTITVQ